MAEANVKFRIAEDVLEEIDAEADQKGLTRSAYIRQILKQRHTKEDPNRIDEIEQRIERLEHIVEGMERVSTT